MKRFIHAPKFFVDRVQIIFALVLVSIVLVIAFLVIQSPAQKPSNITLTHSASQVQKEVTPTKQNGSLSTEAKKAVSIVDNLKDVQEAKHSADASNIKFVVEVDSYPTVQNNFYVIHAYEIVPDGNGNTHTATAGWYRVNPQTGAVTKFN
jgi:hypothetical protein